ncbi:MAG: hypothetical protein KME10_26015 [Plectolyngbya sp. WJT66-NPBG17]|jgi:hypothetical protein|nr:hypothetical protein [Plectolyngbya sp. WJT66-NPBG17]
MMNPLSCTSVSHQTVYPDLSANEQALLIATLAQSPKLSQCFFSELLQMSKNLDSIFQRLEHSSEKQVCQKRQQQVLQELELRRTRFENLSSRLNANLQQIKSLNLRLYDRVFAKINFELLLERALDGDEITLQQELSSYQQLIHDFYEDLTLRQLAPIACQKRRLMQKTKRLEFCYEYLPVLSLAVTTVSLHIWLTWTWSLIAAMFIVGPMLIWFAYPKRCALRNWARHTLEIQQHSIAQGRCNLTAQEAQVMNLLFVAVEGQI